LFFSPVVGLLVLLALGVENSANSDGSSAAVEWVKVSGSLDVREYEDFAQAFPGTQEAYTALKQKRLLEEWQRLDQTDGEAVEAFSSTITFPQLSAEVRKTIESNTASSASVAAYVERLRSEEQHASDLAAKKSDLAAKEKELQAAQAAKSRKMANQTLYAVVGIAIAIALAWLVLRWIDQNNMRRVLKEASVEASIDPNSTCADQEVSFLVAEVREREKNSELRDRIQIIDARLSQSEISSTESNRLNQEVSALRNQLVTSKQYQQMGVARDAFYDCQSSAGR